MDYAKLKELNLRSQKLNGVSNCIYIKDPYVLSADSKADIEEMNRLIYCGNGVVQKNVPDELVCFRIECMDHCTFMSDIDLNRLVAWIMACDIWVSNLDVLDDQELLQKINLLPEYESVIAEYWEEEHLVRVYVAGILGAVATLPELYGTGAVFQLFSRVQTNMISYGLPTGSIDNKLLAEINRCLTEIVRDVTHGVEIAI